MNLNARSRYKWCGLGKAKDVLIVWCELGDALLHHHVAVDVQCQGEQQGAQGFANLTNLETNGQHANKIESLTHL